MELGLLIPESYAEIDGYASIALDSTDEKFLHWDELKADYTGRFNFMKIGCNWCDVMTLVIFYDKLINFIECSTKVQESLKGLCSEDQEKEGHNSDNAALKKIIDQVNNEIEDQKKEANEIMRTDF
jgi:hypothetical protein